MPDFITYDPTKIRIEKIEAAYDEPRISSVFGTIECTPLYSYRYKCISWHNLSAANSKSYWPKKKKKIFRAICSWIWVLRISQATFIYHLIFSIKLKLWEVKTLSLFPFLSYLICFTWEEGSPYKLKNAQGSIDTKLHYTYRLDISCWVGDIDRILSSNVLLLKCTAHFYILKHMIDSCMQRPLQFSNQLVIIYLHPNSYCSPLA